MRRMKNRSALVLVMTKEAKYSREEPKWQNSLRKSPREEESRE
jgi:hypothetical protein